MLPDVKRRRVPLMLIHGGVVLTLLLTPVWYRFSWTPPLLAGVYVSRFLILLPMLWTIGVWLVSGLPGFDALRRDSVRRVWALLLLLLALWAFASLAWAFQRVDYPEVGLTAAIQLGVTALFALVAACAGPPPRTVIAALAVGLLFTAAIAIGQSLRQSSLGLTFLGEFRLDPRQPGVSIVQAGDVRWLRPYGLMPHPNILGGLLLFGLLAVTGWLYATRHMLRIGALLLLPLGLWALLATFSRAAWVGLAVGAFTLLPLLVLRRPTRAVRAYTLAAAALAILSVGLFFSLYRPLLAARVGEGTESVELRSVADRLIFTEFALRSITERPVLGVGIGNFPWRTSYYLVETFYDLRGDNVHHVLLSAFAELGAVGFALTAVALAAGLEAAVRALRLARARSDIDDLAARAALLAGVVALIAIGLFDHYPWTVLHLQVLWWSSLGLIGRPIICPALPGDGTINLAQAVESSEGSGDG